MNSAANPIHHIVILCAGTVDPLNLWQRRAQSYGQSSYWQQYPQFLTALELLCSETGAAIFDAHGWSGDNTAEKRRQAGAYLAERLCGANGKVAYYSGYRQQQVLFHLIGHSHGGNVLNEFTKRAAELTEWPPQWQFASLCYLSTPFLPQLHQPGLRHFATNAQILNVRNRYDLTQQLLACCSLHQSVSDFSTLLHELTVTTTPSQLWQQWQLWLSALQRELADVKWRDWLWQATKIPLSQDVTTQLQPLISHSHDFLQTLIQSLQQQPPHSVFAQQGLLLLGAWEDELSSLHQQLSQLSTDQNALSLLQLLQLLTPLYQQMITLCCINGVHADYSIFTLLRSLFEQQLEAFELTHSDASPLFAGQAVSVMQLDLAEIDPLRAYVKADFQPWVQQLRQQLDQFCQQPSNLGVASLGLLLGRADHRLSGCIESLLQQQHWFGRMRWLFHPLCNVVCGWHPLYRVLYPSYRFSATQLKPLLKLLKRYDMQLTPLAAADGHLQALLSYSHSISRMRLYPQVRTWLQPCLMKR